MGSKDEARRAMLEAGVPVVPGADVDEVLADPDAAAARVGFPLLVKAAAGGGGKGMRGARRRGIGVGARSGAPRGRASVTMPCCSSAGSRTHAT